MDADKQAGAGDAGRTMRSLLEQEILARTRAQLSSGKAAAAPSAPAAADVPQRLSQDLAELAIQALGIPAERFEPQRKLADYGVDSIAITELMAQISRRYGVSIAPTTFFEARHFAELCRILQERYGQAIAKHYEADGDVPPSVPEAAAPVVPATPAMPPAAVVTAMPAPAEAPAPAAKPSSSPSSSPAAGLVAGWIARHQAPAARAARPAPVAATAAPAAQAAVVAPANATAMPIAIISMEGMFPRSPNLETFRRRLREGEDCMEEVPASRWDWRAVWGDPRKGPFTDVKHGGFVAGHDQFDAPFFHISRKEAELMDPQHRLFMECAWKLIEGAGLAPGVLAERKVGIFLGINLQDYADLANRGGSMDPVQMTGLGHVFCPNRLSFLLGVNGPSQVIDTACSSSLVAVHRAVLSIRHEGCDMAIAGGANLMLTPTQHILFSRIGMLSKDGRCKAFSAAADGYARADGIGAVLLKRLDLAERDGDPILAVIRGSAENHGGAATSLTAPNPRAQAQVIVEAHRQADVDPRSVTLIECHGTGTRLGDPVEVEGLKTAFAQLYALRELAPPQRPHCGLGSVKSNIGHTETAAGIAGLIKVVLALQDGLRYRSLHCERPNPLIDLVNSPFQLLDSAQPWERPVLDGVEQPRRAGISSFGAGGANAHVVLEEYRPAADAVPAAQPQSAPPQVVPLSARDDAALRALAAALRDWLQQRGQLSGEDLLRLAYTLQTGRDAMRARLACVAADAQDLRRQLDAFLHGDADAPAHGMAQRETGDGVAAAAALAPAALARQWVQGASVDWRALWPSRVPRRLALPTYVFQHQRYWLPQAEPATAVAPKPSSPLAQLRERAPGVFTLGLSGTEFFLADHRVQGQPVLPGVAYLELAREAALRGGFTRCRIRKVVWMRPLEVPAPVTLEVRLLAEGGAGRKVEIVSVGADGAPLLHMQARLEPVQDEVPAENAQPLAALQAAHGQPLDVQAIYQRFDAMGLCYGPGHRVLQSLAQGRDASGALQVLAQLQAATPVAGFTLHPGLMDGALQACIGLAPQADGAATGAAALPFALESLDILKPCTGRMWVHVRGAVNAAADAKLRSLDLDLLDQDGTPCVRLRGFATRVLERPAAAASAAATLLFEPRWRPATASAGVAPERYARRLVLVCQPDAALGVAALGAQLPQWECAALACERSEAGQAFMDLAARLLAVLQSLSEAQPAGGSPVLLQLVGVAPAAALPPAWTALAAMLRSARMEHSWLCAQLVTVGDTGADTAAAAAQALRLAAGSPQLVEWRHEGGEARVRCWDESAELPADALEAAAPWRADGVYLLTGGAGALARVMAADIAARSPGATVVLAGRRPLEGESARWLASLQAGGARLDYEVCDLTDEPAVEALVARVRQRHGRISGVLHAAGRLRDEPLRRKSPGTLAEVLAPKVRGAEHLDRAIGNAPLDCFVLFASLSGAFGNAGQVDYAAANAWLDAFAARREAQRAAGQRQGRTVALDWPLWREGGMRMEPDAVRLMRQTTGLDELGTAEGLRALAWALQRQAPQVLVAAGDAARVRRHVEALNAPAAPAWAAAQSVVAQASQAPRGAAAVDERALRARILAELTRMASEQLKVAASDLDPDVELTEYGFDSIGFTQFTNQLNDRFDLDVTPTLCFEHPRLGELAEALAASDGARIASRLGLVPVAADVVEPVPAAAITVPAVSAPAFEPQPAALPPVLVPAAQTANGQAGVAIIGLSGVFPRARDIEQFWDNLAEGRDCIGEIPAERWDWRQWWGDPQTQPGRTNVKWGGFIDGMAEFDPLFFGLSPREARAMDPQQRLLLTQAWRVMEHAGYAPSSLAGSDTAVFIGTADIGYGRLLAQAGSGVEGFSMTGLAPSLGPNRISHHFDFHGPSVAVETACSSALVAIHRAAEAIRGGVCATAIAGGANGLLLAESFVGFTRAGMLAPDGRCKPFSAQANGYARGEGVGLVFLKRLDLAERDGDRILGVIRASAENHGGRAGSLTAPNPKAQAALLRQAWRSAGVDPRTVTYIEAHGTGTPLGDPIEVEALTAAFADLEREAQSQYGPLPAVPCGIGSVKSNIGHLELAAGVAGLAKVLLQMRHGTLVPTLHCDQLNPYLKLEGSRFQVVRERRDWTRPKGADGAELPRRAGVSSFGFGGSNAHVVVEEYRAPQALPAAPAQGGPVAVVLSARNPEQLAQWARQLAEAVTDAMPLADVAYTLQCARDAMEHRAAFLCASHQDLRARLRAVADGADAGLWRGRVSAHRDTLALLDADDEMRRAVATLPQRGKFDSLLQLWVRGLKVDWASLYAGANRPRKLDLPGYPFAAGRYWTDTASPAEAATAPDTKPAVPSPAPGADMPCTAAIAADTDVAAEVEKATAAVPAPVAAAPAQAAAGSSGYERALQALTRLAAQLLEVDASVLEPDTELGEYGFDSITMTGFASKTNAAFNLSLTPADFFEFATLSRLARHVAEAPAFQEAAPDTAPQAQAPDEPSEAPSLASAPAAAAPQDDPVVIVGLSCRLPMAEDAQAFWRNLAQGRDCISRVPAERWDWRAVDGNPKTEPGRTNIHWGGFMDGVFEFDPLFFGISPREALLMDPQQRLLLMQVWTALEDAGHAPRAWRGRRVGLFVGTASSGYGQDAPADAGAEGYAATGAVASVGPNRVSYLLDWHGPSEPVETACSSSLVALHRAVQAMAAGDCDSAVVAGVNTMVTPHAHINFAKAGMLSVDGRCKTFAAEANGYVRGEGAVAIVLRRLSDARRDGDHVYAIVRGTAVNHGGRANSLTAPNTAAQAGLLRAAYARAGVDPASVGYVEAHGTGTALGDPVEINALKSVFAPAGQGAAAGRCGIGSVKTNIGHLELAAGLAGVVKVLLQMRHRTLAASLHCANLNPYLDLSGSPFFIVRERQPWEPARDAQGRELPLRAGVSSFGFGGVNAHVVLEEAPASPVAAPRASGARALVPLSARDPERLREQAEQLAVALDGGHFTDADLDDLAWTLQAGREALPCRLALVAANLAELREGLRQWLLGQPGVAVSGKAQGEQAQAAGSLLEIAAQWTHGAVVDWAALYDIPRRRLSLPTYPFAREVYRLAPAVEVARMAQGAQGEQSAAAPAPRPLARLAADGSVALALDGSAFYFADHRVKGTRVLPGAMSLELARAGWHLAAQAPAGVAATLEQVVWLAPVVAGDGALSARLALAPAADGRSRFELRTGAGAGTLHAQGQVGALRLEAVPPLDLDALRRRCPEERPAAALYERFAALGLDYGPAFRAVARWFRGEGGVLAELQLPAEARSDAFALGVHPVLLDAAFQASLGLFPEQGATQTALPFAVDAVHVLRPTPDAVWASVRNAGSGVAAVEANAVRRLDIDLLDAQGVVCVQVRGFSLRLLDPARGPAAARVHSAAASTSVAVPAHADGAVAAQRAAAEAYLVGLIAEASGVAAATIDPTAGLDAYGIDSILITRLTDRLEQDFGTLSKTLFFEHQTVRALASHFMAGHAARLAQVAPAAPAHPSVAEAAQGPSAQGAGADGFTVAAVQPTPQRAEVDAIAVVGLAGRYAGAANPRELWANLAAGLDCITEVPAQRWDHSRYYDPRPGTPGKTNSKWGGFIEGADCFDPLFFNISPREAEFMDPQERQFLECAWEAVEDAGYTRATLAGGADAALPGGEVGVFVGVMYEEYQLYGAESTQRGQPLALPGSPASIANRVSYFFNFHGPSLAVDTMCSSSLSAIHLACESLRAGHCAAALAGGVNLTLHPNKYLALSQGRFTSSRGRCESFGAAGDGYVPGEGVGAVLLKPLSRALADGDQVYGVIRGTALNHGGKTNGYSVPNPHAQTAVIGRALQRAGVEAGAISYVEAHGTGTSLGDPIEIAALARAFSAQGRGPGACAIGSVKSNLGHCESAAGMAGLTKVLLQMKHGQLAPSLHSATLNPRIDFGSTPFVVQQSLSPWSRPQVQTPQGPRTLPRIAGLSSFGAGGSNAHLVIEEHVAARQDAGSAIPAGGLVFPVSVREAARLPAALARLREAVEALEEADLAAAAHVLQSGREAFEVRVAVVAADKASLLRGLDSLMAGPAAAGTYRKGMPAQSPRLVEQLAAAWVDGAVVDWGRLRSGPAPRRISLPTYPFARERYWVPGGALPARAAASLPLLLVPRWAASAASAAGAAPSRTVLVLCEPAQGVARQLAARQADTECLLLDERGTHPGIAARYTAYAARLLELVQRLARERRDGALLLQVLVPAEGEASLLEGLSGLLKTAVQECAGLRCQLLALDSKRPDLAEVLLRERASGDVHVRHAGGQRLVQGWQELPAEAVAGAPAWRDGGVYLITGGSGGIGLLLAEDIARRVRRPVLCLTSRSPLSPQARQRLEGLQATVLHRQVDVCNEEELAALIRELTAAHGRLAGIVHAAGLTRDKLLARKTAGELSDVLAPKVAGLVSLDRATAALDLDFMLLFASASGALGNVGQADYACANAFMDAFAAWRNGLVERGQRRGRTMAIDWPYWQDGGMRMDAQAVEAVRKGFGVAPLESAAGLQALQRVLATQPVQVLVLDGDHARLRHALGVAPAEACAAAMDEAAAPPAVPARMPPAEQPAATVAAVGAALPQPALQEQATAYLTQRLSALLNVPAERIGPHDSFDRFGIDSVLALQFIEALERDLGSLPRTLVFEHPKVSLLAAALSESHGQALSRLLGGVQETPDAAATPRSEPATAEAAVPALVSADAEQAPAQPSALQLPEVSVIAVSGRYPGADDVEAFWTVLREGRDCITEIPEQRWDAASMYSPDKGRPGTSYCKWGGFLKDADAFDAGFFGITPRDASLMDPQERLFLQSVWHLLERAGHTRAQLQQQYEARVGVFVGAMYHPDPSALAASDDRTLVSLASHAAIANRVSFFFDLQGPSVAVDTMCSSGLHAVHQACRSLQLGECRLAIAGGVNLSMHPGKYLGLSRAGLLGSHSASRSFADGDGYLPAEGVGAVLLKPLADALRDGDTVLAVIKASAVNHAGRSAGFGVPSAQAQARLIEEAWRAAGVDARSIGCVEAAANGSGLGDAIELRALTRAFRAFTADSGFCALGSVKSNMGHAESASGMAQLTKVLLQLQHRTLVPCLRPGKSNPDLNLADTPFVLQTELAPWRGRVVDGVEAPLRAAINAFGAGGSNVHLLIEEAPRQAAQSPAPQPCGDRRFVLNARDPQRLAEVASLLHGYVRAQPELSMERLSYTLCQRREPMECAVEFVAADRDELLRQLAGGPPWPAADAARLQAAAAVPYAPGLAPLVLPGYPFAAERHVLPMAGTQAALAESPAAEPAAAGQVDPAALVLLITRFMCEELGVEPEAVRADATFRDHGANSMFALRLIHALSELAGVRLSHRDLERHPTPQALAQFAADQLAASMGQEPPVPVHEEAAEVADPAAPLPLSQGQTSLWVLQRLYPALAGYNVPLAFRVQGIGLGALERSCLYMLERYPLLCSVVEDVEGQPRMVRRRIDAPLQVLSVPAVADDLDFARERAARPFDLGQEVPIRFELLRGSSEILLVVVHHIVFDGISAALFSRELWSAYERFFTGREPAAQAPQTAYAAFVAWEHAWLASAQGEANLAYWRGQLDGELPVLRLPCNRPVHEGIALSGRSIDQQLGAERVHAARQCASRLGVSLASFFLGVLNALLYRYAGQEDLLVAMPTAGRPSRRFEHTIGYFANLILLRTRLSGALPAATLLQRTHAQLVDGLDHAAYPFAVLARHLPRPANGTAHYEVSFSFQNFFNDVVPGSALNAGGTRITHLPQLRQEGDGALSFEVLEEGERLRLVVGYDPARFDESTARRLLGHYVRLVESVSTNPSLALSALDMLDEQERRTLLHWSRGPVLPPREGTVVDWFEAQARACPDAPALMAVGQRLRYDELARRAHQLACHLLDRGVAPGARVGVLLQRGVDAIVALLAVLRAGATWVPMELADPQRRLALVLEDAELAALLTDDAGNKRLAGLDAGVQLRIQLDRDRAAIAATPLRWVMPRIDPDAHAYVIYTSGSTGRPKGVPVAHRAIAVHCRAVIERYALTPRDGVLQFASHAVDAAVEQMLPTLACGACLVLREAELWSPAQLGKVLQEYQVTVADLPPAYLREVLQAWTSDPGQAPARAPRLLIVGGEVLEPDTVRLWRQSPVADARLLNAYGPTEATVTCTVHDVEPMPPAGGAVVPIGRPLAGGDVYVLDRDGNLVPEGVPGEILLGGPRLAQGYLRRPELTRERFIQNPLAEDGSMLYRSGDVGWFIPGTNGLIALRGRIDQQLKVRGFRVEPAEVEAALRDCGLQGALVLPATGSDGNVVINACLAAPGGIDEAALRRELAARLPACMVPARFVVLDSLPLTPGGKVDRGVLAELATQVAPAVPAGNAGPERKAGRDEVEGRLLALWREVLESDAVGVEDDFFLCGGHSLRAVRLLAALQRTFGWALSIGELLQAPSVAQLAALLREKGRRPDATPTSAPPTQARSSALVPLTPATARPAAGAGPLFLVHPVSGQVACYLELARHLRVDRPVYGIQADRATQASIEAMAAAYLAEVRQLQPSGPYHLAGWSLGGVLAYEMARQLRNQGEEVAFLGLIDSYAPALLARLEDHEQQAGDEESRLASAFSLDLAALGPDLAQEREALFQLYRHNSLALRAYRPQPCDAALTLMATAQGRQADATLGWGSLAKGALVLHPLPGDHYSLMQAPHLPRLVELIESSLDASRAVSTMQAPL